MRNVCMEVMLEGWAVGFCWRDVREQWKKIVRRNIVRISLKAASERNLEQNVDAL